MISTCEAPRTTNHEPRTTQCERILAVLVEREGRWVPMPELSEAGANTPGGFCMVHSRISDLRKQGYNIVHENRVADRQVHSYYMLVQNS